MNKSYSSFASQYTYKSNSYNKKYSKQYDKYTSNLDYSSDFNLKPNKELVDMFSAYNASKELSEELPIEKKRSAIDRIFDVLNVGQYVSAGFSQGMVDDKLTPLQGMVGGIMAANPFGKGYEEGEHSYSKVLETSGWKPESFAGKVAKGAVGFVGDVMLDPMTYLSGGLSGVVKGSGKAGVKTTLNLADKLGDSAKFIDTVGDISKTNGITQEIAEGLVKNSKLYKSGKHTLDVAEEGTRLMEKYNKLIGVNSKSADITLSLAIAPLGKKIFGKHAEKSLTLFDSDVVKAFGDSTVAPFYS